MVYHKIRQIMFCYGLYISTMLHVEGKCRTGSIFYLQFCPHRLHLHVVPEQQDLGLPLQLPEYWVQMGHRLDWGAELRRPHLMIAIFIDEFLYFSTNLFCTGYPSSIYFISLWNEFLSSKLSGLTANFASTCLVPSIVLQNKKNTWSKIIIITLYLLVLAAF